MEHDTRNPRGLEHGKLKTRYLRKLSGWLARYEMRESQREAYLKQAEAAFDRGAVEPPNRLLASIKQSHPRKDARTSATAIRAAFAVSLLGFLGLGAQSLWHPGWLVFGLVPFIRAAFSGDGRPFGARVAGAVFYASLVGFLLLGFTRMLWHPGWLVLLSPLGVAWFRSRHSLSNPRFALYGGMLFTVSAVTLSLALLPAAMPSGIWIFPLLAGWVRSRQAPLRLFIGLAACISGLLYLGFDVLAGWRFSFGFLLTAPVSEWLFKARMDVREEEDAT